MSEPRRLLDEHGQSPAAVLLRAARANGPPPPQGAKERAMAAASRAAAEATDGAPEPPSHGEEEEQSTKRPSVTDGGAKIAKVVGRPRRWVRIAGAITIAAAAIVPLWLSMHPPHEADNRVAEPLPAAPIRPAPQPTAILVPKPYGPAGPIDARPQFGIPAPQSPAAPRLSEGGTDFNRGAASAALGAAAGAAKNCTKPGGPTGSGRVRVTFAPSGRVTSAQVQGAPFGGTSVGGCVAGVFRGAKIPPFVGSPVTVTKSFNID